MRQTCSGSEMPPHETMLACLPSRAATSAVMRSVLFSSGSTAEAAFAYGESAIFDRDGVGDDKAVGTGVDRGFGECQGGTAFIGFVGPWWEFDQQGCRTSF